MYRPVNTKFWSDPAVRDLEPLNRYLFLYLMTCDHTHMAGIYHLPMSYIVEDTGMSQRAIEAGIQALHECRLAFYHGGVMWVVNMLKFQIPQGKELSDKNRSAVANQLDRLHKSTLITPYLTHYEHLQIPYLPEENQFCEDRIPYLPDESAGGPTGSGSGSGTGTGSGTGEEEKPPHLPVQEVMDAWNRTAKEHGLHVANKLTATRRKAIRARLKDADWLAEYETALNRWTPSLFCRGQTDRGDWVADLDWFLRPDTVTKILEGKYDDKQDAGDSAGDRFLEGRHGD